MKNLVFLLIISFNISYAQIGVNIGLPERGGSFIDKVKENYRWNEIGGGGLNVNQVDKQGWPTVNARYVLDHRPVAEWAGSIDDPEVYRLDVSGTYKCSFIGRADINSVVDGTVQNLQYDASSNMSTFDFVVNQASKGLMIIDFTNTQRTSTSAANSGFTKFKMLRPGYDNDDNLFHQPLLDILNEINFSAIRYMDYLHTNGRDPAYPNTIKWADRKLATDASQRPINPIGKRGGACWEYIIDLSNRTMIDPWINVPISADKEYVEELAKMFKNQLDPSLNIYVESSNEVWNTAPGFEQTEYSKRQATALGIGERENHARRTAELSQIFASVFGQSAINDKIRVIMCSHAPMLKWWVEPMLQYMDKAFGPPADYIYGIASQTYFQGGHDQGESVDKILDDCHDNIERQIDDKGNGEAGRLQWIKKAKDWKLKGGYFSYEGGPAHGGGSTVNIQNIIRAERHERMCDMMRYNLDTAFAQLGGNLAMQFTLTSAYTRYGSWGLTDDINFPYRNHKMQCVKDMLNWTTDIEEEQMVNISEVFTISPNPAIDQIIVDFSLQTSSIVRLDLVNTLGEYTITLIDQKYDVGQFSEKLSISHLVKGIYYCNLYVGNKMIGAKKFIVVK